MENPITRYLQDAIAAEKSFEAQLNGFSAESTLAEARGLFSQHASETKSQHEALTARLEALGSTPSTLKSLLANIFNMSPKLAQLGHSTEERTVQDLMMAFAVENAEVAMYESLIVAADAYGDSETAALARRIQAQERETAKKVWAVIAPAAEAAFQGSQASEAGAAAGVILRYLQDAEAAERNFIDALDGFSKAGDQEEVQSLMALMSKKAATQAERLASRIATLGGTTSTTKSLLAHLLAFAPLTAQATHDAAEKSSQHLMITYAAAAAEMAMYESLAASARKAGDTATAQLALELQGEEKEDHRWAWDQIPRSASEALGAVVKKS